MKAQLLSNLANNVDVRASALKLKKLLQFKKADMDQEGRYVEYSDDSTTLYLTFMAKCQVLVDVVDKDQDLEICCKYSGIR